MHHPLFDNLKEQMTPLQAGRQKPIAIYRGVRRACDSCRCRKIRCSGAQPCDKCAISEVECSYLQAPKRRGTRGCQRLPETRGAAGPLWVREEGPRPEDVDGGSITSDTCTVPSQTCYPYLDDAMRAVLGELPETAPDYGMRQAWVAAQASDTSSTAIETGDEAREDFSAVRFSALCVLNSTLHDDCHGSTTTMLPATYFLPYVQLFFEHLFPIMPVLDRLTYLDSDLLRGQDPLPPGDYALLTALAAATTVQLNCSPGCPSLDGSASPADVLVRNCLDVRIRADYIKDPNTSTVITSFFLFAYFGNTEQHAKAWYYLQEAITFAEGLDLNDEQANAGLGDAAVQWRRRLFWLLFITERAYAIQRRARVRIRDVTVQLPTVFESEEPRVLYGFVNLVVLFRAVDIHFIASWSSQMPDVCSEGWISSLQTQLDVSAPMLMESIETQKVDVAVSRLWLRILVWQIGVRHGLLSRGCCSQFMNLDYPVTLAGDLVRLISASGQQSWDSHGIGMEQKISDITRCLINVLKCTSSNTLELFCDGRQYLLALLMQLANMRGQESRYRQELVLLADPLINFEMVREIEPVQSYICDSPGRDETTGRSPAGTGVNVEI